MTPPTGHHREQAPGRSVGPEPAPHVLRSTAELHNRLLERRRRPGHCVTVVAIGLLVLILTSIVV